MKLTRSQFLGGAASAAGALSLTGCMQVARRISHTELPEGRIGRDATLPGDPAWRVLNRMAYGPRPGDLERVRSTGADAWIEEQLHPEKVEEQWAAWMRLMPMDTLDMDPAEAEDFETATYPEVGKGQSAIELQQAMVLRSVYSNRQLEQVMVEFWTDHFNISQLKAECSWLKTVDDRDLRKHSLGKFRDLIWASAHSPAMLFYLDNDKNKKQDAGSGANENYARELLELHTLGVDGGYTLKDIQEVARCLTGWNFRKSFQRLPYIGNFEFRAGDHDDGPKRVLGVPIPAGQGIRDGEQVVDIVCRHPSTARFIARKLCRRFVADAGPEPLINRLAEVFKKTDGDLQQVLSELFHSEEFQRGTSRKLKRPFDYVVSALRITNADTSGAGILPYLERMGQLPYKWAMPDGYPDRTDAWTPSLLARWNFAIDLVQGKVPDTDVNVRQLIEATGEKAPRNRARAACRLVLGTEPDEGLMEKLLTAGGGTVQKPTGGPEPRLALLLCSPQFMWR